MSTLCDVADCLGRADFQAVALVCVSPGAPLMPIDVPIRVCAQHKNDDIGRAIADAGTWQSICEGLKDMGFPREPDITRSGVDFRRLPDETRTKWANKVLRAVPSVE